MSTRSTATATRCADLDRGVFREREGAGEPAPTYSALDLGKIEATGLVVPDWEESLKAYVAKELDK